MLALKNYFCGLLVYGLLLVIYFSSSYYSDFLNASTKLALLIIFIFYLLSAFPYYLWKREKDLDDNHLFVVLRLFVRTVREGWRYVERFTVDRDVSAPHITKKEKVSLLFLMVKAFFLPIMLNFFFNNLGTTINFFRNSEFLVLTQYSFIKVVYPGLIALIFLVDTGYFVVGYSLDFKSMKNTIRSVEPTFLGWFVALICYPPFNNVGSAYLPWGPKEQFMYGSYTATLVGIGFVLVLFLIYLWATISLGSKCSNLTNRGIISNGAYRYVRHPAYICKVAAWWIMLVPTMTGVFFFSMLGWSFIYFLRAITEERHLMADPDYREYVKKVPYRFIPGLY